jgi:hypothetical protein
MSNSLEVLQFAFALLVILSLAVLIMYVVAAAVLLLGSLGRNRTYLSKELDCFLKDLLSPVSLRR